MQTVPRLIDSFVPEHYDLSLALQRKQRTFSGEVTISGASTDNHAISLHAKDLTITKASINAVDAIVQEAEFDTITLTVPNLSKGDIEINLSFTGKITDPMHGLYPCYFEHDGVKKELLATQFESHHAREVFPCIDEPAAKATFDLTLNTEKGIQALGNMPVKTHTEDETLTTTFETSPKMSPYLLAFVVGELHSKTAHTKSGVEVNVWATQTQKPDSLDFALKSAVHAIEFFDEYFGVPYPLPKADHVALPDFSSGAMENWGLITYREVCLLADENTSVSTRQYVAMVVAHETSHQWFGNLVTMKWWDDLWLNESFATLMEYICVDALYPEWNIWMTFATSETLSAVRRDYLPNIQPVKTAVNHPDEISTLFDPSIVYAKGARLMAMLHRYVGEDAFRAGLKAYFQTHAYGNTAGQDLWSAIATASHQDIAGFMTPWLEQPGLPVVHLERTKISQERFVLGGANPTPDAIWPIPLASEKTTLPQLFTEREQSVLTLPENTKLNTAGRSHFVTHYVDQDILATRIAAIADGSETDPADRLTLLHDTSLLARGGYASAVNLLELAIAYQHETDEPVWDIISLVIADLKRFVESADNVEKKFKAQIVQIAKPTYERLGWTAKEDETESDTKLRATVIGLLVYGDDENVIAQGLADYRNSTMLATLPGETRSLICGIVAKHGSHEDVERLISTHQSTQLAELKGDIAAGLTSTHDPELITRLIGFMKDETFVRLQDVDHWFVYLMRNRYSREATWGWLTRNWGWIETTFGGDKSYDNFARYSASALSTREWLERYIEFFGPKKDIPALNRAIELGISDIQARVNWLERDQAEFIEKL